MFGRQWQNYHDGSLLQGRSKIAKCIVDIKEFKVAWWLWRQGNIKAIGLPSDSAHSLHFLRTTITVLSPSPCYRPAIVMQK